MTISRRGFLAFLVTAPVTSALPWGKIANVIAPIAPATAAAIYGAYHKIFWIQRGDPHSPWVEITTDRNAKGAVPIEYGD